MAKHDRPGLRKDKIKKVEWSFPLNRSNFLYLAIGIGVILLGYILLATGITEEPALPQGKWNNPFAVTIAPILLIIGYCVIIPYGIIKLFKNKSNDNN